MPSSAPQARTKELERDLLREFQEREQTYHDEQLLSTRRLAEAEHRVAQLTSGEYCMTSPDQAAG